MSQGSRVKGQWSRVKSQESRVKSQLLLLWTMDFLTMDYGLILEA
jgi:hypothetical protein